MHFKLLQKNKKKKKKNAAASGDLIGNKIANRIRKAARSS